MGKRGSLTVSVLVTSVSISTDGSGINTIPEISAGQFVSKRTPRQQPFMPTGRALQGKEERKAFKELSVATDWNHWGLYFLLGTSVTKS
ncbi:hypothetical protein BaRGS_00001232, partial [Batillaria attramentaria]